jgi:hypothetical protein
VSGLAGLFGLLGGSSVKQDRKQELQQFGNLSNVFNWALPLAKTTAQQGASATAAGVSDIGSATSYFKNLMSGGRAGLNTAVAPEAAAATSASDAAKRQLASSGTARGGGVAGVNQQRQSDVMAKVDQLLFGAQTGAASEVGKLGTATAGIGLGETGAAISAGGVATDASTAALNAAIKSRQQSFEQRQQTIDQAANSVDNLLSAFWPGGGGVGQLALG